MPTYSPNDTWQALMRSAQGGDAAAYRTLLESLRPWLVAYFRRRLMGSDGEDLVQMTLLSLHEKRHTYDPSAPFLPWISAVARNKLIDYVRRSGRHVHVELNEELGLEDGMQPDLAARDVAVLLAKLPKDQARLIKLHKLDGLSVEEVSSATGKSASAVKVGVHRGLKKLQAMVGIKGAGDE
ncbi:MAG: sigma-70 family RNA polymerase sigma factor [Asticcacaulis sp.]|uniref:sigma-70 family RNA polymerase sigma factor n=1 Tax=Asticcacaulis sp. TaxID=1872648 RepID=UPI0039E378BB